MAVKHHHEGNVLPFRGRGVRAQLREAKDARVPVQIARERVASGWLHGFVIGLSTEFCLLAEVSDSMQFDGFLVIAVSDVSVVEQDPGREFVEKALKLNGESVPELTEIRLDHWQGIAESIAAHAPLVSLNMLDEGEGEVSYIGRLTGAEPDALVLQEVDPNARWYPDTGAYEFSGIGSIGFGTRYMMLLAQVAGVPPVPVPAGEFSV